MNRINLSSERTTLSVRLEDANGLPVLVLEGELDLATAPQFAAAMEPFSRGATVVVDLCELDFMDSSGVRELMRGEAVLGEGLRVVCGSGGPVRRLFELASVDSVLSVYSSRAEAVRAGARVRHQPAV